MHKTGSRSKAFLTAVVVLSCVTHAEIAIVTEGKPTARIVLPANPAEKEALAAEELSNYLVKMSGGRLPVFRSPVNGADSPTIFVGKESTGDTKQLDLTSLAYGGYVIDVTPGRIILAGNEGEGALNAVYALLEDVLGVRWFMPTEFGEHVPRRKTVSIPDMKTRVEPRFVNRRMHGVANSVPKDGTVWKRRIRLTDHSMEVPFSRYSHNLNRVIRPSRHGKSHPEYFPERDGERHIPSTDNSHSWQPCTTNPDVIRLTIEAAHAHFAKHPEANCFSVGMNDGRGFCECKQCRALDIPGRTFRGRTVLSDRYFAFVKAVAEPLLKTHPDKYITCIAYSLVEAPPLELELPSNVGVVITQDTGQWHDPEYRQKDSEFATAWAENAGAFGTYNYTSLGWLLPRCHHHLMADSLRLYDRIGAKAVTNESWPSFWYAGPLMYLRAKMMWDPKRDADAILDEFYTGFFGPAAPAMKRLYGIFEARMHTTRPGKWFEGLSSVEAQIALWAPENVTACNKALQQAREAAGDTAPFAARVAFVASGFAWIETILQEFWQAQALRDLAGNGTRPAEELLAAIGELAACGKRRDAKWELIKDNPLIVGNYLRVIRQKPRRLSSWKSFVSHSSLLGTQALFRCADGETMDRLQAFVQELPDASLRDEFEGYLWIRMHPDAPNLLANPGCEVSTAAKTQATGIGWVSEATPPNWSKWALVSGNQSRMTWEATGGRSAPKCMKMTGVDNACFIQTFPAEPGERYNASVYTKALGEGQPKAGLFIQWKNAKGQWVQGAPIRQASVDLQVGNWRKLCLVFTVPKGVGSIVFLCRGRNVQADSAILFDDAALVRLPDRR